MTALTAALQAAAHAGGQPPLLICTDQEGGIVKRLPWAPPTLTPTQLGGLPPAQTRSQGVATGRALRAAGIDADLAPVADVPSVPGSFIARQGRAYSTDPATDAARVVAFAQGLRAARVAATVKHFPGLGMATRTTDRVLVTIPASAAALQPGLLPFQSAVTSGVPMVMISNATYPAYGPRPAAWSQNVIGSVLRGQLGFTGVVITDSLDAAASVRGWSTAAAAVRSAASGADLLLITGSEPTSQSVYERLVAAARDGTLSARSLQQSYARIVALKRRLG